MTWATPGRRPIAPIRCPQAYLTNHSINGESRFNVKQLGGLRVRDAGLDRNLEPATVQSAERRREAAWVAVEFGEAGGHAPHRLVQGPVGRARVTSHRSAESEQFSEEHVVDIESSRYSANSPSLSKCPWHSAACRNPSGP